MAGSGLVVLDHLSFAVWHFRQKDALVSVRIELPLVIPLSLVVGTRSWVLLRRDMLIFDAVCRLKHLACSLGCLEVADRCPFPRGINGRVIEGWPDSVVSASRIHVLIRFL